jgi:hypothetical protein
MLLCGLTSWLGGKEASQTHSFSSESGGRREFSVFCDARGTANGEDNLPTSFGSSTKLSAGERTAELGFLGRTRIERSSRKGLFIDMLLIKHPASDFFCH